MVTRLATRRTVPETVAAAAVTVVVMAAAAAVAVAAAAAVGSAAETKIRCRLTVMTGLTGDVEGNWRHLSQLATSLVRICPSVLAMLVSSWIPI